MKFLTKKDIFKKLYGQYEKFCQAPQLRQLVEDEWQNKLEKKSLLRFASDRGR